MTTYNRLNGEASPIGVSLRFLSFEHEFNELNEFIRNYDISRNFSNRGLQEAY